MGRGGGGHRWVGGWVSAVKADVGGEVSARVVVTVYDSVGVRV